MEMTCMKKYLALLIGGLVVMDLIIFLRDPLTAQPHEPDVSALLRLGDVQRIPLATNASSATIMLWPQNLQFPIVSIIFSPFWKM